MKIVLQNLTKKFPDRNKKAQGEITAVGDFSYEIPDGKLVSLLGPSGCGKSTTLNLICGLEKPDGGKVFFGDQDVTKLAPEKRGVGMVFQNYALYPHLTVRKNILFPMENLKGKEKLSKEEMKPGELSGGQQQRVAIARALVKTPNVLLLDEPLSNLDARLRLQTREEIRRIQRETKLTTVFVTHDQEEALSISDLIVVMKDGVLQQTGKPQEVYDSPANLFVAKFLGTPPINLFAGRVSSGKLWIGDEAVLDVQEADGQEVTVGIRPEGFLLKENGALGCSLNGVEVLGRDISVVCSHPACSESAIRAIIDSDNLVDTRSRTVCFDLKPEKVFLFDPVTGKRILMANGDKKAEGAAAGRGSAV